MVPMVRALLSMNFMLPVPEASVPAVEICSERSAAGITAGWQQGHAQLQEELPMSAGGSEVRLVPGLSDSESLPSSPPVFTNYFLLTDPSHLLLILEHLGSNLDSSYPPAPLCDLKGLLRSLSSVISSHLA